MKRTGTFENFILCLLGIFIAVTGCSGSGGGNGSTNSDSSNLSTYQDPMVLDLIKVYSTVNTVTVHVAYEPDAVPFTGTDSRGDQYWSILKDNLVALFDGRMIVPDIFVPQTLDEMYQLSKQGQTEWTTEQLVGLARSIWNFPQSSTTAEFYVVYVNGYYNNQGTVNKVIIGLSIPGTPVVAVFKDLILNSGFTTFANAILEQATLVHEFGHALGLVNNGVPMVINHEDPEHPHHCTNDQCIMFWVENSSRIDLFTQKIIDSPSDVLFGPECLEDVHNFRP